MCKNSLQIPVMCRYLQHCLCYSSNISTLITPGFDSLSAKCVLAREKLVATYSISTQE